MTVMHFTLLVWDELTEANQEQSTVSNELFVSGQLPKLTISVFSEGDTLQNPVWKNAFNALVDSRPLAAGIKLNMLNVKYLHF